MRTFAWGLTLAAGASLAVGASGSISGSGTIDCPNMPVLNPNPPSKTGGTDVINFAADSIIIPMDNCYQRANFPSDTMVEFALAETYGTLDTSGALTLGPRTIGNALCEISSRGDEGQLQAYAVIQRLVEDGIPVHWALKADKRAWAQADFTVVGGSTSPVKVMAYNTVAGAESDTYAALSPKTISYAGAPFIIDADHAADARTLIASYGSAFDQISYHVAQTSFDAPIYKSIGGMPSMAVVDLGGYFTRQKTSELQAAIGIIGMDASRGTWWDYILADNVRDGGLLAGSYDLVWVPSFGINSPGGPSADEKKLIAALESYAAAGGSIVFQDEAAAALEGDGTFSTTGAGAYSLSSASAIARVSNSMAHSAGGFIANLSSSTYGGNSATELVASDDYSDPASQWGGAAWIGTGGAKTDWTPRCDTGYRDGVRRMVYTNDLSGSTINNADFASWRHYGGDETLGRTYYLGGYNMDKNRQPIFRLLMNTVMVSAGDFVALSKAEVGRSAPIVATVGGVEGQYTGTFDANFPPVPATIYTVAATANAYFFPDVTGHVRGLNTAELATGNTAFSSGVFDPANANYNANLVLFDAADAIASMSVQTSSPCAIGSGCRHIFTNDGATKVTLTEDNLDNYKAEFGLAVGADDNDKIALMKLLHAGADDGAGGRVPALGGIDRSTMALVESSPIAGSVRPTVAYVGGLDGMMHAICADLVAPCTVLGQELWAFLPRTELSKVASNETRIDGSPKVADVFADFGSGTKEYKTVLTFQTGNEAPSATYGLDITDPSNPAILWQNTTPGAGTNIAMAVIHEEGQGLVNATFVQTASGTTTAGMYLAALNSASGEIIWSQTLDYPSARNSANSDVPASGLPGGLSVFSSDGGDIADTVLAPSLWGAVFAFEAKDGINQNGTSPLFQFTTDFHPIGAPVSVYRDQSDGLLKGVIASGGFTDSLSPTSTLWAPDSINQYAISFPIVDNTTVPILDTDVRDDSTLGVYIDLGAGNRAFSQPTIIGNEIFLTTDSADVNSSVFGSGGNTGTLFRVSLATGAATSTSIPSGAASVDVSTSSNAVYTGGGNAVQKTDITGYDANGSSVEASAANSATRYLWLRTQ